MDVKHAKFRRNLFSICGVIPAIFKSAILLILFICTHTQAQTVGKSTFKIQKTDFFSLELSPKCELSEKTLIDFKLYTVSKNGKPLLRIYVGNQPRFPSEENVHGKATNLKATDFTMKSIWNHNRLVSREVLFSIRRPSGWISYLHAWAQSPNNDEMQEADRMLSSICLIGNEKEEKHLDN